MGCHLNMQNREWWLRPPLREISFPRGFGLGMMEGWETITRDGETEPSVRGTGTEDYFNGAWYYLPKGGRFSAPYHGCILRDLLRSRIAVYRFDMSAPVSFSRSLRVSIDHGFSNELDCDYSSTAYWYQTEPHRPWPNCRSVHLRQAQPATGILPSPHCFSPRLSLRCWLLCGGSRAVEHECRHECSVHPHIKVAVKAVVPSHKTIR